MNLVFTRALRSKLTIKFLSRNKYFVKIKNQFWRNIFCIYAIYRIFCVSNFVKIRKSEYSAFCRSLVFTCNGVQHNAKAMITTIIILVTRILFSFPLHLFRVSRAGPGPWVAALPRHNLNNMFMYNQRIVNKGSANIVTKTTTCFVDIKK